MAVHIYTATVFLVFLGLFHSAAPQTKTKRQIFREQVLPRTGGKIPEDAFRADRLALNRLNKEGIAVPDGILLEHRNVHHHPHVVRHDPEDESSVIRVLQQSENRYVPAEGRYHNEVPDAIASTYIIRQPIGREETKIRTPDQQQPLHRAVMFRLQGGYLPSHHYSPSPPSQHYSHPQEPVNHQPPLPAFKPIPVPFELPNKEIHREQFYSKPYENNYISEEYDYTRRENSGRIDWRFLDSLDNLPQQLNNVLPPDSFENYGFSAEPYQYFGQYELPQSPYNYYSGFYPAFNDRFVRKSPEGFAKGSSKQISQPRPNRRAAKSSVSRTEFTVRHTSAPCKKCQVQ